MAIKMNLWSLTLLPGEKYPLYIRRDFQITNAALGEDLPNPAGRSVIKVTHHPIHPSAFDSDDDDDDDEDSELDSELEREMRDEFDMDEDEDEEIPSDGEEVLVVNGKKGAKVKVNGGAAGEDEVDEDDEDLDVNEEEEVSDEEEEDEDEDYSDDEPTETSVLCSLTAGKIEQATLNLVFVEGEVVLFEASGENPVHLMGNYIDQFPNESESEFDSEDEHDDYSDLYDSEDEEIDVDGPTIEEIDEVAVKTLTAPKVDPKPVKAEAKPEIKAKLKESKPATAAPALSSTSASAPPAAQKRKADTIESPAGKPAAVFGADAEGLSKSQKKKLKKAKRESEGAAGSPAVKTEESKPAVAKEAKPKEKAQNRPQKKTLPSGLTIEDTKVGDGPVAKGGKRLGMRYIGKLENGKQFDANTAGKPFSFVLGRGEVIKGWDEGLVGMAVGGERRLTIPAGLAYGKQQMPGIPRNSTLKFDVKLVSVG